MNTENHEDHPRKFQVQNKTSPRSQEDYNTESNN